MPMLLSCSVGAAPVAACSSSAFEFLVSSAYQVPWYSIHDFSPSLIMPNSRFCPAMPRLIVMFTAVGSLPLEPSAWKVTPSESSAFAVGSVIFAVSPSICRATSATNEALSTVAILASLSLTIWSAGGPEAVVAAAGSAVDASSPPQATATERQRQHEEQDRPASGDHGTHRYPPVVFRARDRRPLLFSAGSARSFTE